MNTYARFREKPMKIKTPVSRKIFLAVNAVFLSLFALVCLLPFVNLLAISLSSAEAVDAGDVGFFPINASGDAYKFLLQNAEFFRAFGWSILRVVLGTAISLAVIILAAYPLSKSDAKFKGRSFYTVFFTITMFFSGGLVPTYMVITKIGLSNKIWALVLPTAMNAWNMVLLVNFFRQIPAQMEEAAMLEGAGNFRILVNIYLPVSLPAIATVTLFTAVQHWNSWFDGAIYMNSDRLPLQSYIYNMINEINNLTSQGNLSEADQARLDALPGKTLRSAQIFIAMLPIMLVYPFAQKFFVKGLVLGSVKE